MKNQINRIFTAMMCMLFVGMTQIQAQVTSATPGVALFCNTPGNYDLGSAADGNTGGGANPTWRVVHSATQLDNAAVAAATPIVLTNVTQIPAANIQTGYLYISQTYSDACDSEIKEIPVYVFKALTASITGADDYCEESPKEFTAAATSTDAHTTFAYQWYTFDGTNETVIAGATGNKYTPTGLTAGNTTSYKVRIGYLVGANKYCSNLSGAEAVTVTAKPTVNIVIEGVSEIW